MTAALHIDDANAVHLELIDQTAFDEVERNSLYAQKLGPTHVVAYGKDGSFFETVYNLDAEGRIHVKTLVTQFHAVVAL